MSGWISLHRKIKKHWIWQNANYLKIWLDILLRANHEPRKILFNNDLVLVKRGQFITSLKKLAKENGCSVSRIRHILNLLESDQMIERITTQKATQITICNYDSYQESRHTDSIQKAHRKHTESTLKDTNNNYNNENNENNNKRERGGLTFDVASEITDESQKLMLTTFGRNPKIPEMDIINKHLETFGYDKTKQIYKKAVLSGFNLLKTLDEQLLPDGTIKPKENNNGSKNIKQRGGLDKDKYVKVFGEDWDEPSS